jgi:hypothetical protein
VTLDSGVRMRSGQEVDAAMGTGAPRVVVPLTGDTLILGGADSCVWFNPAGAIAALTVRMPSTTLSGSIVNLGFNQAISTLTMQQPSGTQISAGSVVAGQGQQYRWINATAGWVRWM